MSVENRNIIFSNPEADIRFAEEMRIKLNEGDLVDMERTLRKDAHRRERLVKKMIIQLSHGWLFEGKINLSGLDVEEAEEIINSVWWIEEVSSGLGPLRRLMLSRKINSNPLLREFKVNFPESASKFFWSDFFWKRNIRNLCRRIVRLSGQYRVRTLKILIGLIEDVYNTPTKNPW